MDKWYVVLRRYIGDRKGVLAAVAVTALIFTAVLLLYDVSFEAALYGFLLCAAFFAVAAAFDFGRYFGCYSKRRRFWNDLFLGGDIYLEPQTNVERDYIEMIGELRRVNSDNRTEWENERRESMDYYAAWVHQAKTPISAMHMILDGEDSEVSRDAKSELIRIEQYVEMALCYSRLNSGSSDFVFARYDLDSIIRRSVRRFAPQFIRRRISLKYEPCSLTVLTDEKWLTFIIEQILSNAVKYTESGGAVTVSVTDDKCLHIADTGIGISEEDIPRIFEKGFTGYNGRGDRKSTGLGLYLCRKAAEKLSHKISVESQVGRGSVFTVNLGTIALRVE